MNKIIRSQLWLIVFFLIGREDAQAQIVKKDSLFAGAAAPTFFSHTLAGEEFYLSDYCGKLRQPWKHKQQYIVLLSFFATWCQPCLKEIPDLTALVAEFAGEDLKVFLVAVNEKAEIVKPFTEKYGFQLPVLLDSYGVVARKYGAEKLPRYVLIDKNGKIVLLGYGYSSDFKANLHASLIKLFDGKS